jgi:hypothetical protein
MGTAIRSDLAVRRGAGEKTKSAADSMYSSPPADPPQLLIAVAYFPSGLEVPARGSERFSSRHTEGGPWPEFIEVPRWWPGARGAERRGERAILDGRRPALRVVALGETLECWRVGHLRRCALDDEVEIGQFDRDDAFGPFCEVSALACPGAAREVEPAVDSQGADARDVRPSVGPDRGKEVDDVLANCGLELMLRA